MSYTLCDKLRYLEPYQPIEGQYHIRLDANESFIRVDDQRLARLSAMLSNLDLNRYPDPYATEVCESFARYYSLDPACVTAGNGSDELIGLLFGSFLQKGERAMIFSPEFSMYQFYAHLAECEVIDLPKDDAYQIDVDGAIRTAREQKVRMIIFSNPCNPTSVGLRREEVLRLIAKTDALVVVDEAYMDFFDQSVMDMVKEYDNLIVLRTCSKAVGAAAIRLGFAVAGPKITRALRAAKSPYNVDSLTQAAGRMLFSDPSYLISCTRKILQAKRQLGEAFDVLCEQFPGRLQIAKSDTNFFYIGTAEAKAIYEGLLAKSIAVRYMGDHLRITVGAPEENMELVKELANLLKASKA